MFPGFKSSGLVQKRSSCSLQHNPPWQTEPNTPGVSLMNVVCVLLLWLSHIGLSPGGPAVGALVRVGRVSYLRPLRPRLWAGLTDKLSVYNFRLYHSCTCMKGQCLLFSQPAKMPGCRNWVCWCVGYLPFPQDKSHFRDAGPCQGDCAFRMWQDRSHYGGMPAKQGGLNRVGLQGNMLTGHIVSAR